MKRTIQDFIDKEYREYALHTIQNRAIPSLIDGLKPSQRKALYTALRHCKMVSIKTSALTGYCMAVAHYNHGNTSMDSAIANLTQDFPGSNNIPMFIGTGNFGNRWIPEPSASRYTSVKLNPEFLKFFTENDVLTHNADLDNPEPETYLPIIPWVLANGVNGVAVGFATNILPRNPQFLIDAVKEKLETGNTITEYPPFYKGWSGEVKSLEEGKWEFTCWPERKGNKIIIRELPIGFDRDAYIAHLDKLYESGKIKDYFDPLNDEAAFEVVFEKVPDEERILTLLKLRTTVTENLTVIDSGKLVKFDTVDTLVDAFIEKRLRKYEEKRLWLIEKLQAENQLIEEKKAFIRLIQKKEIDFLKQTKADIVECLKTKNFKFIKELVNSPIYKYAKDEILLLETKKIENQKSIKLLEQTTPTKMWIEDLKK